MQYNSNDLISVTLPQIPKYEESLKEIEIPFTIILRPFLYDTTKIQYNLLKIPKCKNCAAYFSPITQWITPHSQYYCCMCHEVNRDQHQRFISLDRNRISIPELKEMCIEYSGNYERENIPIKTVFIIDKSIFNQMKPFFNTITQPFLVLLCSE